MRRSTRQSVLVWLIAGLACAGCSGTSPTSSGSSPTGMPPSVSSATTAGPTTSATPTAAASGSGSSASVSTSAPDVFAEVSHGAVQLRSARSGAVVRTLVPAGTTSSTSAGGRDFAVVGPSFRYVYYTDVAGAARVPLEGGAVEQLPKPPGPGDVMNVYSDRSDTRFEETIGYAGDTKPHDVVVTRLGSTTVTHLGSGPTMKAAGWNVAGSTAYVTTTSVTTPATATQVANLSVTITGIPLAAPTTHTFRESLPSVSPGNDGACGAPSTATAIGPTGQIGWVLGGCSSAAAGKLTYAFRVGEHYSLAQATFPTTDQGLFATSLQYTPSGTAVLHLTHQDCAAPDRIAVDRRNSGHGVDLPIDSQRCR